MIHIGKSYIQRVDGRSRLCADVTICPQGGAACSEERNTRTLWFAIDSRQEDYLAVERADAFVFVMLVSALRYGHDIVCEDPMSERLHYQLCSSLIPALTSAGSAYHAISIRAPLTREPYSNQNAVGTGFSGGADCLYTIMTHGRDCEYPLTHIAVFNAVTFQKYGAGYRDIFRDTCRAAEVFAREQGLETVFVDTNFFKTLNEDNTNSVCPTRHFACSLALQGLFSTFLISSDRAADEFTLDLSSAATYDLLSTDCASTESLVFYSAGAEAKRYEKLAQLSNWEPSYRWLHACYSKRIVGQRNCGTCKKCKEAQTILYALGKLDRYEAVFDVEDYKKKFPQYLADIMANQDAPRARQVMQVVRDRKIPIPRQADALSRQMQNKILAKRFRYAMQALKQAEKEKEAPHE